MGCSNSTAKPAAKAEVAKASSATPAPAAVKSAAGDTTKPGTVAPRPTESADVNRSPSATASNVSPKRVAEALPPAAVEGCSETVDEEKPCDDSTHDDAVAPVPHANQSAEEVVSASQDTAAVDVVEQTQGSQGAVDGATADEPVAEVASVGQAKGNKGQRKNSRAEPKNKSKEVTKENHARTKGARGDAEQTTPESTSAPQQQTKASKKKRDKKGKKDEPAATAEGHANHHKRDEGGAPPRESATKKTTANNNKPKRNQEKQQEKPTYLSAAAGAVGDEAPESSGTVTTRGESNSLPSYQEMLEEAAAAHEGQPTAKQPKRKVLFDAETMRKTAPKGKPTTVVNTANLNKKQKEMLKRSHVSTGRRGPVSSKWDKGGKVHMQTDVYMAMAAAFERMLTNAETINAHLDSR